MKFHKSRLILIAGVLLTSLLFFCFVSCSKDGLKPTTVIPYMAEPFLSENATPDIIVSMGDIINLLQRESLHSKSEATLQYDITPYIGQESDTLMYIVNFKNNKGWRIYSTDKRTPAILAEGENGYFSFEDGSPAIAVWMSCVAANIARVRHSSNEELTFSNEEICANIAYWSGEDPPRAGNDSLIINYPPGHWEETVTSQTIIYDTLGHMVAHWDQDSPYNKCCPFLISEPYTRAPAGCIAIAGAQLLYYLHYKIGAPAMMYSEGYCNGNLDNPEWFPSNPSSTVWSFMSVDYQPPSYYTIPEAILIRQVGDLVGMQYCELNGYSFSWTLPLALSVSLFPYYGISCSRDSYNEDVVKASLLNQMPVIVSASNLMIPVDGNIHCFVIDGYKRTCKQYTHYHYYVMDELPDNSYLILEPPHPYTTYTYSNIEITSIKINWGWRTQWSDPPVNDGWYSLTDGWTVTNNGTYDYNYYRNMTYGFSLAN